MWASLLVLLTSEAHFISKWRIIGFNESLRFPLYGNTSDLNIKWGDDTDEDFNVEILTHVYQVPGLYDIRVWGTFSNFLGSLGDCSKLISISEWGGLTLGPNTSSLFAGCSSLTSINTTDKPKSEDNAVLDYFFKDCISLDWPIDWDTEKVVSMKGFLQGATRFNSPLKLRADVLRDTSAMLQDCISFNQIVEFRNDATSLVQNMSGMFQNARMYNQAVTFVTTGVVDFSYMFNKALSFNKPITFDLLSAKNLSFMFNGTMQFNSAINFSNTNLIEDMSYMLAYTPVFDSPIAINTESVMNMQGTFHGALMFDRPIVWSTPKVRDMAYFLRLARRFNSTVSFTSTKNVESFRAMFEHSIRFDQEISFDATSARDFSFFLSNASMFNSKITLNNTGNVTKMESMFSHASKFNQALVLDTSNVEIMSSMFLYASKFNQPLLWNTSSCQKMDAAFFHADAFVQNLESWDTTLTTSCPAFCGLCGLAAFPACDPCANQRVILTSGWSACRCPAGQFPSLTTQICGYQTSPGQSTYVIPAGKGSLVIEGGAWTVYVNSTANSTILVAPLNPNLLTYEFQVAGYDGRTVRSNEPIEFGLGLGDCAPTCRGYDPAAGTFNKLCVILEKSGRGSICSCNTTFMAYIFEGVVCDPPKDYAYVAAIAVYISIIVFVIYRVRKMTRWPEADLVTVMERLFAWRRFRILGFVILISVLRVFHNIYRVPGQGLKDGSQTFLLVTPLLLQFVILRLVVTPQRRLDSWITNTMWCLLVGFGGALFALPTTGSRALVILAVVGIVACLEGVLLYLLIHFSWTGYLRPGNFLDYSICTDHGILAFTLILLVVQSICSGLGFQRQALLITTAAIYEISNMLFLMQVCYKDHRDSNKGFNEWAPAERPPLLQAVELERASSGSDAVKAWYDAYADSEHVADTLFTVAQIKNYSTDALNALRPLLTIEAEVQARQGAGQFLRTLSANPKFRSEHRQLPNFLENPRGTHPHPFRRDRSVVGSKTLHAFGSHTNLVCVSGCDCCLRDHQCELIAPCIIVKRGDVKLDVACLAVQRLFNSLWRRIANFEGYIFIPRYFIVGPAFLCMEFIQDAVFFSEMSVISSQYVSRFANSTVGLCLSAYVLGLDHPNFMVKRDGYAFTFNFGQFLHSPEEMLALTREFHAKLLEQDEWDRFVDQLVAAYMVLRPHHRKIIRLAQLSGVVAEQVAQFISSRLQVGAADDEAQRQFVAKLQINRPMQTNLSRENSRSGLVPYRSSILDVVTIPFDNIEITKALGQGAFGRVDQCIWTGADCAIKRATHELAEKDFRREVDINRHLFPYKHQFVVSFFGVTTNPPGILMELYPLLSVENYVIRNGNIQGQGDLCAILTILINASAGVTHLHKHGVIHRDIAARNFLIKHDLSTAICDFGLALLLPSEMKVGQRTIEERMGDFLPINTSAPETQARGEFSTMSDVFMFGNFIWELFARQRPYSGDWDLMPATKNFPSFTQRLLQGLQPEIPAEWHEEIQSLLKACWDLEPARRPRMSEVNGLLRQFRNLAEERRLPLPPPLSFSKRADVSMPDAAYYEIGISKPESLYSAHQENDMYRNLQGNIYSEPSFVSVPDYRCLQSFSDASCSSSHSSQPLGDADASCSSNHFSQPLGDADASCSSNHFSQPLGDKNFFA